MAPHGVVAGQNSKAGCLFRPNFLKQVVFEIEKIEHLVKNFQSTPLLAAELFHYPLHCDHQSFALNILVSTSGLSEVDRIQNFDL